MQSLSSNSSTTGRILAADSDLEKYCSVAIEAGVTHAKQIDPNSVVTAPWVRLKCQFGCPGYGNGLCCPPHTPTPEQSKMSKMGSSLVLAHAREGRLSSCGSAAHPFSLSGIFVADGSVRDAVFKSARAAMSQEHA